MQADPLLRYKDLQARFHVNSEVVRSAINGGIDKWRQFLGMKPLQPIATAVPLKWEHACAIIRSTTGDDGSVTYQAMDEVEVQDDSGAEPEAGLSGLPTLAAALDAYGKLGWELAALVKVGKGDGEFTGAWEATFKRQIQAKKP
ncbi:MAG: hypothetical protein GYA24_23775 [Candidatus Lokiarchaeota archaeon]|nr:hypothetical protein [Candidatus Lokiarchaeota archaeon]